MNKNELDAARELLEKLVEYYDDSELQPAIIKGDARHRAICDYRDALPGGFLPPDEGELMRRLLDLSRAEGIHERRDSQSMAERWAKLLLEKYDALRVNEQECARELRVESGERSQTQREILEAIGEDEIRGKEVARRSGYAYDGVRRHLSLLVQLKRVEKTRNGYRLP